METNVDYFERRAQQEREAAMKAQNASARWAHREMADRYETLSKAAATHGPSRSINAA